MDSLNVVDIFYSQNAFRLKVDEPLARQMVGMGMSPHGRLNTRRRSNCAFQSLSSGGRGQKWMEIKLSIKSSKINNLNFLTNFF